MNFSIDNVTPVQVAKLFPTALGDNIRRHLPSVLAGLREFGLTDRDMVVMALATIRAETAGFVPISEGQHKFNTAPGGAPYALYDNRAVLGNRLQGDGARFKGRGFIQLTGRDNYTRAGKALDVNLVAYPDMANDSQTAGRVLAWFLKGHEKRIREVLAEGDLKAARRVVNGGDHGLMAFSSAFNMGAAIWPE